MGREEYDDQRNHRVTATSQRTITIDGLTLKENPEQYRKQIGYIPETPSLYEELTLREHIEVTAMAYDLPQEEAMKRAERLLKPFA